MSHESVALVVISGAAADAEIANIGIIHAIIEITRSIVTTLFIFLSS
jgi:hypothetical protein